MFYLPLAAQITITPEAVKAIGEMSLAALVVVSITVLVVMVMKFAGRFIDALKEITTAMQNIAERVAVNAHKDEEQRNRTRQVFDTAAQKFAIVGETIASFKEDINKNFEETTNALRGEGGVLKSLEAVNSNVNTGIGMTRDVSAAVKDLPASTVAALAPIFDPIRAEFSNVASGVRELVNEIREQSVRDRETIANKMEALATQMEAIEGKFDAIDKAAKPTELSPPSPTIDDVTIASKPQIPNGSDKEKKPDVSPSDS